ncbi:MAG TPA: hypothetical protein VFX15_13760, partial [Actinomycetes bacterium]|nr:hypothetical protein [Actinomycetes bacterium]
VTRATEVLVMLDHVVSATGVGRSAPASSLEPGVGMVFRRWAGQWNSIVIHRVDGQRSRGRIGAVLADAVLLLSDTEIPQQVVIPTSAIVWATTAASSHSDD